MTFAWPSLLWLLAAVPLLVAAYVAVLRRRKRTALRYAQLALVREALAAGATWRRHVPPALFLASLAVTIVAIARPTSVVMLPVRAQTVVLAMDVSGSMRATDVKPNRLAASQAAAKAFVREMPASTRVGIVSFAGTASVVQPPTANRKDAIDAIDRFQLQRGTATGSGIMVALATLFPDAGIDVSALIYGEGGGPRTMPGAERAPAKGAHKPVPAGSYHAGTIIMLTDGQRTTGPDPDQAAKVAADYGVRVYTVGFGTPEGEVIGFEGWSFRARLDEDALKSVARITHGDYFRAASADELKAVYEKLGTRIVMERKEIEVTALFAAAAAALALVSAGLSLAWFNRLL